MSGDPLRSPPPPQPDDDGGVRRPQSPRAIQFVDNLVDTATPRQQQQHQQQHLQDPLSPTRATPSSNAAATTADDMPLHTGYGATGTNAQALRDPHQDPEDTPTRSSTIRAAGPGRIQLPPSPYTPVGGDSGPASGDEDGARSQRRRHGDGGADADNRDGEDDATAPLPSLRPFRPRAASSSPSVSTTNNSLRPPGQRRMSFKRRMPANPNPRANFLQRASMGVFPSRKASDAGSEGQPNWRRMRRVHTASVHPAGQASGDGDDPDGGDSVWGDVLPSIPRLLPSSKPDPYSTPIPTLPFVVLCLVVFGEFSSAGVAGPFLFFMIEDFGVGGESDVGFWAGIVSAAFFFAQFLTSLMWASVAEKRGRRFVLMVSLVGNASSLVLFGASKTLPAAIAVRMAQGFFNGAVGVAKGAIRDITDETNEGRAYAQMGFYWGMGGIVGPILGGLLEHPVKKYPGLFGGNALFAEYPYLLPCMAAAFFTALGAFFSLFIGYDGGPRTGKIQLPEKADVGRATSQMASNVGSIGRSASKRISGYFGGKTDDESLLSLSRTNTQTDGPSTPRGLGGKALPRTFTQQVDEETGGPPSPVESEAHTVVTRTNYNDSGFDRIESQYRPRLFSRTEERQRNVLGGGSAYGYEARRPSRSSAAASQLPVPHRQSTSNARQDSFATSHDRFPRPSFSSQTEYAPDFEDIGARPHLNFAQRFLLAQDDSVFTISDLWVAAAINGEDAYEDVFEDDEEDEDEDMLDDDDDVFEEETSSIAGASVDRSIDEEDEDEPTEGSPLLAPRHLPPLNFAQRKLSRAGALSDAGRSASSSTRPRSYRRPSGGRVPSLYANTGIESPLLSPGANLNPFSPSASLVASPFGPASTTPAPGARAEGAWDPTLAGIPETQSNRNSLSAGTAMLRQG
ncbi:uncharacterized protein PFL1_00703 [Pseudozyma flocculosa PF-1]|uniref:uncharacterized protein n=1 Tax=Pseudozyma flocculosa PF-1 TaxID=1277687 RepID=UPI0004560E55|nr:uncharacterized protein PFL1_00703 [Pseudozyma flocculosa PF-1]EPQ31368.1 hypothetical protein PFL1_00703 [Pseudozyma flocculosa PF-1]